MVTCYLLFLGMFRDASLSPDEVVDRALTFFLAKRGEGVGYAAQRRCCVFFEMVSSCLPAAVPLACGCPGRSFLCLFPPRLLCCHVRLCGRRCAFTTVELWQHRPPANARAARTLWHKHRHCVLPSPAMLLPAICPCAWAHLPSSKIWRHRSSGLMALTPRRRREAGGRC